MKDLYSNYNKTGNKLNEHYILDKDKNKVIIDDKEKTLEQYNLFDMIFFVTDPCNDLSTPINEIKDNDG